MYSEVANFALVSRRELVAFVLCCGARPARLTNLGNPKRVSLGVPVPSVKRQESEGAKVSWIKLDLLLQQESRRRARATEREAFENVIDT